MAEPPTLPTPSGGRFVVLYHEMPLGNDRVNHWDFMLQRGEALATWAVEESPDGPGPLVAHRLADHRQAYLEYEGEISGGRGYVTRWDQGRFETLAWSDDTILVSLIGERLRGTVRLERREDGDQRMVFEFAFSAAE